MERKSSYSTMQQICKRLEVSESTVLRWFRERGLPIYKRKRGIYRYWYSTEALLTGWELAQCALDREGKGYFSTKPGKIKKAIRA